MPIEIQALTSPATPGSLVQFNFKNPVTAYAIGLNAFSVSYGDGEDHWVQNFMITFMSVENNPEANQVSALVQVELKDASGHSASPTETTIWPVCIAVTGNPQPDIALGVALDIPSGTSQSISLPREGSDYTIGACFLSGFDLGFTSTDHQVLEAHAGCGITWAGEAGQVSAAANMTDARGNQVQTATVDGGYIVSSYQVPLVGFADTMKQTAQPVQVSIPGLKSIGAAAAFIRNFNVQYDSVHNVQGFKVGSWGAPTVNGTVVTLPNLSATMWDNSGNVQGSSSGCDVVVIAVP